jgi:rod shape-determining protein MreC
VSDTLIRRTLLIALLVLGVFLATVTRQSSPRLPGEFSANVAPLFGWSFRFGQNAHAALSAVFDRRDLRAEQRAMQEELEQLKQENQRLYIENRRLQATLRVQVQQGLGVVAVAPVIDDDASGLYRRLILGLGSNQGLRVSMPVRTADGLVGVITEVTENRAVVRTLLDPESVVAVRFPNSPGRGQAFGAPPRMLRVEVPPEANVKVGERIFSGALQGLYPAGITVGTVTEVQPSAPGALKKILLVRPAVQFSLLDEVQVLRPL